MGMSALHREVHRLPTRQTADIPLWCLSAAVLKRWLHPGLLG
jgi:hypothetical protein